MLKKTEFQQKKLNTKETLVRATKINGRDQNVTIVVDLNHNKGLYTISPKITANMITGKNAEDKALIKVIGDLTENAVEYCKAWREDWAVNNRKDKEEETGQKSFED